MVNSAPASVCGVLENPADQYYGADIITSCMHTNTQVLTKELDVEREQRWKAEQATGRLVEHVRGLQSQLTEAQRRHELAVVRAAQLEREVGEEQGGVQGLQSQVQELQVCVCVCVCACVCVGGGG